MWKQAKKQLAQLPDLVRKRVLTALTLLAADPYTGKKLQGELTGLYRLAMHPYRIIYIIDKDIVTVTVVEIGHRQGVYK